MGFPVSRLTLGDLLAHHEIDPEKLLRQGIGTGPAVAGGPVINAVIDTSSGCEITITIPDWRDFPEPK